MPNLAHVCERGIALQHRLARLREKGHGTSRQGGHDPSRMQRSISRDVGRSLRRAGPWRLSPIGSLLEVPTARILVSAILLNTSMTTFTPSPGTDETTSDRFVRPETEPAPYEYRCTLDCHWVSSQRTVGTIIHDCERPVLVSLLGILRQCRRSGDDLHGLHVGSYLARRTR